MNELEYYKSLVITQKEQIKILQDYIDSTLIRGKQNKKATPKKVKEDSSFTTSEKVSTPPVKEANSHEKEAETVKEANSHEKEASTPAGTWLGSFCEAKSHSRTRDASSLVRGASPSGGTSPPFEEFYKELINDINSADLITDKLNEMLADLNAD